LKFGYIHVLLIYHSSATNTISKFGKQTKEPTTNYKTNTKKNERKENPYCHTVVGKEIEKKKHRQSTRYSKPRL
jgi:hypothetical protein